MKKKHKTSIMLTTEAQGMLRQLAKTYGVSQSITLELIIRAQLIPSEPLALGGHKTQPWMAANAERTSS